MIKIIFLAISLVSFVLYRAEKLNASGHQNWNISNSARQISETDKLRQTTPFSDTIFYLAFEPKDKKVRSSWDLRPFLMKLSSK